MLHGLFPLIAIIVSRISPPGIISSVFVGGLLSFALLKTYTYRAIALIVPLVIVLLFTPECSTPYSFDNREWYGSGMRGMCGYLSGRKWVVDVVDLLGVMLYIGSAYMLTGVAKLILGVIAISCILFKSVFIHPVPLLEREKVNTVMT